MSTKEIKKLQKRLQKIDERLHEMQKLRSNKNERIRVAEDHSEWARLLSEKGDTYNKLMNLMNDR